MVRLNGKIMANFVQKFCSNWTCEQVKTLKLKLALYKKGWQTSLDCYIFCDTKIEISIPQPLTKLRKNEAKNFWLFQNA